MKYTWAMATLLVVAACGCQSSQPLFNGGDLSGWVEIGSSGAWAMQDGLLVCNGSKTGYAWLCTDRKYGDFELTVDWRAEKETNSGIFLRVPQREGRSSMLGMEVQCRDDAADTDLTDVSGAVFRRIPAPGKFARPVGEWNSYRIAMKGRQLRIELNGQLVSDVDIDTVKSQEGDPPMSAIPDEGYIGLQNHGTPIAFRNVRLKEMK